MTVKFTNGIYYDYREVNGRIDYIKDIANRLGWYQYRSRAMFILKHQNYCDIYSYRTKIGEYSFITGKLVWTNYKYSRTTSKQISQFTSENSQYISSVEYTDEF